jgi:spore maturation protein SpmB
LNVIFFAIVAIAFVVTAIREVAWTPAGADDIGPMQVLSAAVIDAAGGAVTLAIGLVGVMALFLGLMKVAEAGGLLTIIARTVRPLMVRLFPDVPAEHPAMGAMILIRAMQELDKLNPVKGTASNSMALFLAINTSSVTLLPTGIIALRAASGSVDPAGIVPTTLFATICSTTVAIVAAKLYQRFWAMPRAGAAHPDQPPEGAAADGPQPESAKQVETPGGYPTWVSMLVLLAIAGLVPLTVIYGREIAPWIIPGLLMALLGFGAVRRVKVYEMLVEGAKEGFEVALRIIPYLVAILVAVAMFRASGALEMLIAPLGAFTATFGLPADALPMALLRPLSGSGAYGLVADVLNNPDIGPDSYVGYLVSTLQGSTETTFYVLAVYFGAVQVRRVRHALLAGLTADVAGIAGAVIAVSYLYG